MYYLCTAKSEQGTLAERLGNGLQNRVEQFDSARYLLKSLGSCFQDFFVFHTLHHINQGTAERHHEALRNSVKIHKHGRCIAKSHK